ncbi:hypothetical protein BHC42_07515 [Snodgrassella alvi]|nr:hypothetical protein BHC42_07515 [Snodgrassella alvi]PIT33029.1 hypothetical protein BHC50_04465 [Snodgrassella alvi]PXY97652.1 hypothetical protein DKK71_06460 [Snodgrassella alvi]
MHHLNLYNGAFFSTGKSAQHQSDNIYNILFQIVPIDKYYLSVNHTIRINYISVSIPVNKS